MGYEGIVDNEEEDVVEVKKTNTNETDSGGAWSPLGSIDRGRPTVIEDSASDEEVSLPDTLSPMSPIAMQNAFSNDIDNPLDVPLEIPADDIFIEVPKRHDTGRKRYTTDFSESTEDIDARPTEIERTKIVAQSIRRNGVAVDMKINMETLPNGEPLIKIKFARFTKNAMPYNYTFTKRMQPQVFTQFQKDTIFRERPEWIKTLREALIHEPTKELPAA